jgi:hypothetical protein
VRCATAWADLRSAINTKGLFKYLSNVTISKPWTLATVTLHGVNTSQIPA